jgi:epimerase transport system membrane fusion protein
MSLLAFKKLKSNDPKDWDINHFADDRPVRYFGYTMVIVVFGLFGAWSFFAPLGSAALAPGSVTV